MSSLEEKNLGQYDEPEEFRSESYDYGVLRDVIRDESLTMEERSEAVSEMEKMAESGNMYAQYPMGKLWRTDLADPGPGGSAVLVRTGGGAGASGGTIFPLLSYTSG